MWLYLSIILQLSGLVVAYEFLYVVARISEVHFSSTALEFLTSTLMHVSTFEESLWECSFSSWCRAVCLINGDFIMTNMLITGDITDTTAGSLLTCMTSRPRSMFPRPDVVLDGPAAASQHSPPRVKENLLNGVHAYEKFQCYYPDGEGKDGYILVEFPSVKMISKVIIFNQPAGGMNGKNLKIEVRVGNETSVAPNFQRFALLGVAPKPSYHSEEIIIADRAPLWGKFVSIQETDPSSNLQVCFLEIA